MNYRKLFTGITIGVIICSTTLYFIKKHKDNIENQIGEDIKRTAITEYVTHGKDTIYSLTTYLTLNKETLDTLYYSHKMKPYISDSQFPTINNIEDLKKEVLKWSGLTLEGTTKKELKTSLKYIQLSLEYKNLTQENNFESVIEFLNIPEE